MDWSDAVGSLGIDVPSLVYDEAADIGESAPGGFIKRHPTPEAGLQVHLVPVLPGQNFWKPSIKVAMFFLKNKHLSATIYAKNAAQMG